MPDMANKKLLKMSDLIERTGVRRQTIHYYINKGLLPRPIKTSKNMAYYEESYVERIRLIKELQLKKFLPLNVIRDILSRTEGKLSSSELDVIKVSGEGLVQIEELRKEYEPQTPAELSNRLGLPLEEIEELEQAEIISSTRDERGEKIYLDRDIRIIEAFALVRKGGLTKERGFSVEVFRLYVEFMRMLAVEEVKIFSQKFARHFPEGSARLLPQIAENAIESVNNFICQLRRKNILEAIDTLTRAGDEDSDLPAEEDVH